MVVMDLNVKLFQRLHVSDNIRNIPLLLDDDIDIDVLGESLHLFLLTTQLLDTYFSVTTVYYFVKRQLL